MYYDNLKMITSTKGMKVDIVAIDHDDIVWDQDGDLDEIKKRIEFDLTYLHNDDKISSYWKHIENEAEYVSGRHKESVKEWTKHVLDEYFSGDFVDIRQPLDTKIGQYNCMKAHYFLRKKQLCQGECMAIIESGKFYPEKKKNHYVWKYDPDKGKIWKIE